MLRAWPLAPSAIVLALLVACGGNGGSGASRDGPGALIIARLDGIYERRIEATEETLLLGPDQPNSFLMDPAVSPDGSRIAFVVQPPPALVGEAYDSGSDLWIANRNGTGRRLLYEHEQPNALTRFPAWLSGDEIAAVMQSIEVTDGVSRAVYTVQVVDVESGTRRKLLDGAVALGTSPDGEEVAVAQLSPEGGESLVAAPVGGGEPRTLVGAGERLLPIAFPRYSPDGAQVAFAAAESLVGTVPSNGGARSGIDGPPQDIWVVSAAGGPIERVADLDEDSPSLAWDGSGDRIYVLGGLGLYDVNVRNGAIVRIGEGAFHGQLEWAPGAD